MVVLYNFRFGFYKYFENIKHRNKNINVQTVTEYVGFNSRADLEAMEVISLI